MAKNHKTALLIPAKGFLAALVRPAAYCERIAGLVFGGTINKSAGRIRRGEGRASINAAGRTALQNIANVAQYDQLLGRRGFDGACPDRPIGHA